MRRPTMRYASISSRSGALPPIASEKGAYGTSDCSSHAP